jgi:hypothetical protein
MSGGLLQHYQNRLAQLGQRGSVHPMNRNRSIVIAERNRESFRSRDLRIELDLDSFRFNVDACHVISPAA